MRQMPGGYLINSFFDVWTEISLDGGQTWSPSQIPAQLELQVDPGLTSAKLSSPRLVNGRPTFSFPTQPGLTYLVEVSDSLTNPSWRTINGVLGTGQTTSQTDFQGGGSGQRFYRARVEETLPSE